jgi:hypothetical protein
MAAGILAGKIAPAAKMESSGALGRMEQKPWTLFFMVRQHWKRSRCIVYIVLQLGKFYLCVYCPIGRGTRKHGKNRIPNQVPVLTAFRKKSPILKECEGANSTNE